MPKEIFPSSYVCDCGYQCDFSENTVNEIKAASMKRKQALIADDGLHGVIFDHGGMIALYCPRMDTRKGKRRRWNQKSYSNSPEWAWLVFMIASVTGVLFPGYPHSKGISFWRLGGMGGGVFSGKSGILAEILFLNFYSSIQHSKW